MFLLLPPSETKRDGGDAARRLDLSSLGFPALGEARAQVLAALSVLAQDEAASVAALGLGPSQSGEVLRNRQLDTSAVMPAVERYTGVLYDGLDAPGLSSRTRRWLGNHVLIGSALFGLLRADDPIPAYRLSHDSRLPGMSLRRHWRGPVGAELVALRGLILDLRSEMYAQLGPAPQGSWYLRVVAEDSRGRRTALSHFNKKAKGEFTRAVAESGITHRTVDSLLDWARSESIRLEFGADGELDLVV